MKDVKYGLLLLLINGCLLGMICRLEQFMDWKTKMQWEEKSSSYMKEFSFEDSVSENVYEENKEAELRVDVNQEGILKTASSQKVIYYETLCDTSMLPEKDYHTLLKIVEAEAGGEDQNGKQLVANVILNRVESEEFPDTVTEVVYQKNGDVAQFQPVSTGSIDRVVVSQDTITAVEEALSGKDESEGALYFAARKIASPERMKWFDENLTYLFTHGGHEFFK